MWKWIRSKNCRWHQNQSWNLVCCGHTTIQSILLLPIHMILSLGRKLPLLFLVMRAKVYTISLPNLHWEDIVVCFSIISRLRGGSSLVGGTLRCPSNNGMVMKSRINGHIRFLFQMVLASKKHHFYDFAIWNGVMKGTHTILVLQSEIHTCLNLLRQF